MTGFTGDWLALREPADRRARDPDLVEALTAWRRSRPGLAAVDLAAGTGATVRYLAPRLGGKQAWLLLDHNGDLLDQVAPLTRAWAGENGWCFEGAGADLRVTGPDFDVSVRTRSIDLSEGLHPIDFASSGLVTASALLDLVSAPWLHALAEQCIEAESAFYASLSYDGRMALSPVLPLDQTIRELVNLHQTSDKGFGEALGPDCNEAARLAFEGQGYDVRTAPSDWCLDRHDQALLEQLYRGWAEASAQLKPGSSRRIDAWLKDRLDLRQAPRARTVVGHRDLLALPCADDR